MDFGPDFRDSRSNFKGLRPYPRDFMSYFKDYRDFTSDISIRFLSRISEIFGHVSRITGILGIAETSGILGQISGDFVH